SMLANALSFAAGQAIFNAVGDAVTFLKNQTMDAIHAAIDHQQILAQTVQALKSTKAASGETASSIDDLANSLSQVTPFSEDAIAQTENLELTFTNIGKNVFPQATQAILDVSQAMHQDLQSSAIQVGKALGDPLTGMTALQRIGVTFTAQEKEQIKTMMAHNDVMGAQKIILKELNTEFGGSAEAAGKTLGGALDILKNKFEDLKIKVGTAVMPILADLMSFVSDKVFPIFENLGTTISGIGTKLAPLGYLFQDAAAIAHNAWKDVRDILFQVGEIFQPVSDLFAKFNTGPGQQFSDLIGKAYPALQNLGDTFHQVALHIESFLSSVNIKPFVDSLGDIGASLSGLAKNKDVIGLLDSLKSGFGQVSTIVGGQLKSNFKEFMDIAKDLGKWWQTTMAPAIASAMPGFEHLASVIATTVVPAMAKIWAVGQQVAREVMPPLIKAFETIAPIVVKVGGFLADNLGKALQFLMPYMVQAAQAIGKFADEIIVRVVPIVQNLWASIMDGVNAFMPIWKAIWPTVSGVLQGAWEIIVGVVKAAWALVSGIIKIGLDLLSGNWKQAWTDLKDMFNGIWDGMKGIVKGAWDGIWSLIKGGINFVIGLINDFIGGLDSLHVDVGNVHVGVNIPKIPLLAAGGDITSGGYAWMGEHGPELAYMPTGTRVLPAGLSQQVAAGGGSGQPIIVQAVLQVDGRMMSLALLPHMTSAVRHATGIWGT
ncbi:MAG: phage tail protein, partial [Ktedonobacteraceae bacterium]